MYVGITCILHALMRGHVVAVMSSGGARFTLARLPSGHICRLSCGAGPLWYRNLADLARALQKGHELGYHYDPAVIDDVKEEGEFLAGNEAAAVLIDPPPFLRLAA